MENLIDSDKSPPKIKHLWTIWLLLASVCSIAILILLLEFDQELGSSRSEMMRVVPIFLGFTFVCSVTGFIFGVIERKSNKSPAIIGIVLNLTIVLLFMFYAVSFVINKLD